jgi:glutamyl-tRNA synthetase
MTEIFDLAAAAEKFSFDRVNKAGGKFDWDKLNWVNGQYLHTMPVDQLIELLLPYWQAAGYAFTASDRPWLEQITALIAPSLSRLDEAVDMTRYLFTQPADFTAEATTQLQQEGSAAALQAITAALPSPLTAAAIQDTIKQVVKEQNIKKGLVMRSLRAALTGAMHGPDLAQSWLILQQRGWAQDRLARAIAIAK